MRRRPARRPSGAIHIGLSSFSQPAGVAFQVRFVRCGTVDVRSAGTTRRWQLTIAMVAALSLFVALIAGSSLRPQFAAAALPEPAAWTHGTSGVHAHAKLVQLHAAAQPISYLDNYFSQGSTPMNKKPFHSMWMTAIGRPVGPPRRLNRAGWHCRRRSPPQSFSRAAPSGLNPRPLLSTEIC